MYDAHVSIERRDASEGEEELGRHIEAGLPGRNVRALVAAGGAGNAYGDDDDNHNNNERRVAYRRASRVRSGMKLVEVDARHGDEIAYRTVEGRNWKWGGFGTTIAC